MAGIYVPQKKQAPDDLGKMLQIGGMAAGAAYGGPAGASLGGSLGGMIGGIAGPEKASAGPGAVDTGGSDALQRRMSKLQENPQMQIANSIDSLKYIQDPGQRAELAMPLLQADYMARNRQA